MYTTQFIELYYQYWMFQALKKIILFLVFVRGEFEDS